MTDHVRFKYHRSGPASRLHILKLEKTPTSFKIDGEGSRIKVDPQINIWAGTEKFILGEDGLLSEIELDWLASELSDWLNLPITQEE